MTTSSTQQHHPVRPIISQPHKPIYTTIPSQDDLVDSSSSASFERLTPCGQPLPLASTSTLASSTSVNTYDSSASIDEPLYTHDHNKDPNLFQDTLSIPPPIRLLPSDAAIPKALPVYNLPPLNPYPIRPTSPSLFSSFFPTLDKLTIRHDDLTPDGNMNLRIETPPHFIDSSSSSRHRRPVAYQLFHLRMHDLARREVSLRRYCRDSGREVCSSKREFVVEGQETSHNDEDEDEEDEDEDDEGEENQAKRISRPDASRGSLQRSVSTAFRSVKTPFQRSSNASSLFRRPGTSSNNHQAGSNSSSGSSLSGSASSSSSHSNGSYDKLSSVPSTAPSTRHHILSSPKPIKSATDTIKLEFSNYARVEVTRRTTPDTGAILYTFEWWGQTYAWRRVVDEHTEAVSYHLVRDGAKGASAAVAHIVPEMRGLEEVRKDREVGGWVPPSCFWISDAEVLDAKTDVCDVIMATGLITLVDDSIRTRWQVQQPLHHHHHARPFHPVKSYTGDGMPVKPKNLLSSIFQRRKSEQYNCYGKPVRGH